MIALAHQTQLGHGLPNLCGQTCVAMLAAAALGRTVTPVQVARETGHDDGSFSTFAEMLVMLRHYGLDAAYLRPATFAWWRALLAEGGVGIALVDYRRWPNPDGYVWAHFVLAAGKDATHITVFNPLRRYGPERVTHAQFRAAIESPSLYVGGENWPEQALSVTLRQTPETGKRAEMRALLEAYARA